MAKALEGELKSQVVQNLQRIRRLRSRWSEVGFRSMLLHEVYFQLPTGGEQELD